MGSTFFQFGERRPEYDVPVLNERAVRAAAGILFVPALLTFAQALQNGNFQPTRIFVIAFLIDFTIRLFINPAFAPTLILGQWIVNGQQPEWVGAPQKRFAWGIGMALAVAMFFLMVIGHVVGPINMLGPACCSCSSKPRSASVSAARSTTCCRAPGPSSARAAPARSP